MSTLENDAITQLLSSINEKKIDSSFKSDLKKKKCVASEKNCCKAAVRYNTIGNAYKDRLKNIPVYLVREEKNGIIKTHAYARCSKTTQESIDFCHLHCRMVKFNNEGLKIFEKDVLPLSKNDKNRWLANINDDFFENMGKRGAKKKNGDNNYTFTDENHPILLILNHKNPKLLTQLSLYASQLLKSNFSTQLLPFEIVKEKQIEKPIESTSSKLNNLMTLLNSNKSDDSEDDAEDDPQDDAEDDAQDDAQDDPQDDAQDDPQDDPQDESDSEDDSDSSQEEPIDIIPSNQNVELHDSAEDESESESESDVQVVEIYSTNGKLLYYDEENNSVIEPEGNDSGEIIGTLKEISKEYHTVFYNDKHYSVVKELKHPEKGKIYCCVLTNKVFDKKMKLIGSRTKLKNKEYRFDFI
jgi:hypothetical protein